MYTFLKGGNIIINLSELIEKIEKERLIIPYKDGPGIATPFEKNLFEGIVESLCEAYSNEEFEEDVENLSKYLSDIGFNSFFSWLDTDYEFDDIQFFTFYNNIRKTFYAEIDLTNGNSAPFYVLKFEGDILKLVDIINEKSPILGCLLFE